MTDIRQREEGLRQNRCCGPCLGSLAAGCSACPRPLGWSWKFSKLRQTPGWSQVSSSSLLPLAAAVWAQLCEEDPGLGSQEAWALAPSLSPSHTVTAWSLPSRGLCFPLRTLRTWYGLGVRLPFCAWPWDRSVSSHVTEDGQVATWETPL